MKSGYKGELNSLIQKFKSLDKKVVSIFLSIALLQVISYNFASVKFFHDSGLSESVSEKLADLYASLYWFSLDIILLFLIPLLIIKFYFHDKLRDYGLIIGDWKVGLPVSLITITVMAIIIWFVSASEEFLQYYPSLKSAGEFPTQFLIYEIALFVYIIAWEFIWRGYMLFGLERKFGFYAVFIQMIPFVLMHSGKPLLEMLGAIPGGILLGYLALRTRSIFYGVIIHFAVMLLIDLFSIIRHNDIDYHSGLLILSDIFSHLF